MEGGVKAVQLREKDLGGRDLFVLTEKTKKLCEQYQAALFVNDRIDVALGVDADGVQLGSTSMPVKAVRSLIGEGKRIGVSTHSLKEAVQAQQAGADFILFGPVYFTPSKAVYGKPQGLANLKKIVEKISLPVYAIGGIKAGNVGELKKTGIQGIALISAIMEASNPLAASRELLRILGGGTA